MLYKKGDGGFVASIELIPADYYFQMEKISKIKNKYPFTTVGTIGKSHCNREIAFISIGNPLNQVLMLGGVHGSEWITTNLLLLYAESLCEKIVRGCKFDRNHSYAWYLRKSGITFVPCLNPDGVEIAINGAKSCSKFKGLIMRNINKGIWQANGAGVDINHNFPAGWDELHKLERKNGIFFPSNTRYGGTAPASEPETQAIMNYCDKKRFRYSIAFHSQGEEIYWSYGDNTPECSRRMAKKLSEMSGYALGEPEGLAVGGGFKDWFIQNYNKPAFTIEIGKGKNPLPLSDFNDIYNRLEEMLVLSVII
ncbi:MAG: M14 family metallocarboxypeptidase [Clostridia bacterium]|nr:M14 family metallocarboxypeptidase [Clostridia bacterium]